MELRKKWLILLSINYFFGALILWCNWWDEGYRAFSFVGTPIIYGVFWYLGFRYGYKESGYRWLTAVMVLASMGLARDSFPTVIDYLGNREELLTKSDLTGLIYVVVNAAVAVYFIFITNKLRNIKFAKTIKADKAEI